MHFLVSVFIEFRHQCTVFETMEVGSRRRNVDFSFLRTTLGGALLYFFFFFTVEVYVVSVN